MNRSTNSKRRQRGMSSFGWIAVFGIFALLLLMFFKVFPFYYGNYQLRAALDGLAQDTQIDSKSKKAIWLSLQKRLFINEVRAIRREHVTMERKDGKTTVTIDYEVRDNYLGPLFIGAHFVESVVIER
ncbi:MAG: DUF4845 domain-containing protein [Gammaproteobacteria bacterium]|nr:DUF4845 domain-containing protein [Gammaproteobacteria bacterium]MDH3857271.1 DUF4845 domain-containing protein [Gammaproteobacteria bacterium]